ncbi:phenylacetic acid degradation protein PaaN [Fulvivirgaceae bacterium BMA10]|uniref:Phenylacetic acid degradation protein PaaN n=1 Tax=Splendidivirga corallicola TaxID=3051826 RepID=A0ABT8KMH4_9BACT|nr:phenylacetic acid degradation protein PaaN [Fulvivirgaceae bacterium BMA10]
MNLFDKHKDVLDKAIAAIHDRAFYAQYPEHPSPKIYGETADAEGRKRFQALLGKDFSELLQDDSAERIATEESPYLQEPLNIGYPSFSTETLIEKGTVAFHQWRKVNADERAAILIESLELMRERFFEIAYATMHTTGQGYMMAFQASGPHAADRALEAIAAGYEELKRFPENKFWDKPMGKFNIQLEKEWRAVPKGISLVIGCSTFPTWNTVPGLYASLITGNPVIVKPHPGAVLPIAIVIAGIQKVLADQGHDPNICQLAVDSLDKPIAKVLAENPEVKLIDFTGNSEFGSYLESLPGKNVFTEKTGVNSAIIDSVEDVDKVVQNLAFSVALYSGQMCTAPQNFYIPENGIKTSDGNVSFDEFAEKFVEAVNGIVSNPKMGPFVLGTIQNKNTCQRITDAEKLDGKIWLTSTEVENPMFKTARTASPVVVEIDSSKKEIFSKELFGPIALLIKTKDTDESIALAKEMALNHGAISCGAYTTDPQIKEKIADEMSLAATPVSFNLTGPIYVNQNAGFSDFHVTGGNPSGNASFTNPEYVVKRFTWVGLREPAKV